MDGMIELYKAFYEAWEALQSFPKKGAPSPEKKAALAKLEECAAAIRSFAPTPVVAKVDPAIAEYRSFATEIASIAPQDTRGRG
jgi:hypothetical protein